MRLLGVWNFRIDGPLMGAVRMTRRGKFRDPRAGRYAGYKRRVRLEANSAGVPDDLPPGCRAAVSVFVTWRKKARADLDNVWKAIVDALWERDRGVNEMYAVASEETGGEEHAAVIVKIFRLTAPKRAVRSRHGSQHEK
jgi:Holliday junction resolvase RusA-like endonuclease